MTTRKTGSRGAAKAAEGPRALAAGTFRPALPGALLAGLLLALLVPRLAAAQVTGCFETFDTRGGTYRISLTLLDERRIDRYPFADQVSRRYGTVVEVLGENSCTVSWRDTPGLVLTCGNPRGRFSCSGSFGDARYRTELAPSLECVDVLVPWAYWLINDAYVADACR